MDEKEIAEEMLNFLNETGNYHNFLDYVENKGFDRDQMEKDIENKIEEEF